MTDTKAAGQAEFEAVTSLTTTQAKRVLHAVWYTPGRLGSTAVKDERSEQLLAEADAAWEVWHQERYGEPPTAEQRKYRRIASQVGWSWPVLCLGKPGTAKTSIGEGYSRELGFVPNTIVGSQQRPEAVGGYPVHEDGAHSVRKVPEAWVDVVCGAMNGAVQIFDEITTAEEDMEAAMLRIFSDRAAGDRTLVGRVRVIGFGNRPGEVARARDLSPASANRFLHIRWEGPTAEEWAGWVVGRMDSELLGALLTDDGEFEVRKQRDPNVEEMRVLKAWPAALAKAKAALTGFVTSSAGSVHSMPAPGHPDQSQAWVSHRTNEIAIRAYAACIVHNLDDTERLAMLGGIIGVEATNALIEWITERNLPDAVRVLDNAPQLVKVPDGVDQAGVPQFKLEPGDVWAPGERLDVTAMTMLECAQLIAANPHDRAADKALWHKRASHWWDLMLDVVRAGHTEAVFRAASFVVRAGYGSASCASARVAMDTIADFVKSCAE